MREHASAERIGRFMRALGGAAREEGTCYLAGGATAVQVLSKLERGHAQDREDVRAFLESGLVDAARLRAYFEEIEPELYRFPAIDPLDFRQSLEAALDG